MRNNITFLTLLFFCYFIYGQQQSANWYFGQHAGIKFNNGGSVTELTNGQIDTEEGCASISDGYGNLLFYTDGKTVYNKLHEIMPNGTNLKGDASSTQSAIVIPRPNHPDIYYIFTVDTGASDGEDLGFNYYLVDMTLDNGNGDVVGGRNDLLPNCTEKLCAVLKDCEDGVIWVLTQGSIDGGFNNNVFFAFQVTENGVNESPVVSEVGMNEITEQRGYLKISPDGNKLVSANISQGLFLFDFDSTTGEVNNTQEVVINFNNNTSQPQSAYGLEFSPSNQFLYVSTYFDNNQNNVPDAQYGALLQYNLEAIDISGTEQVIHHGQMYRGGLQLGPNGKIYRAMSVGYNLGAPYLSVINNPNLLGNNCNYSHNSIPLTTDSRQGLPPFISSFFLENIDIIQNGEDSNSLVICSDENESYTLSANAIPGATYTWKQNGTILPEDSNQLVITTSGIYELEIDLNNSECEILKGYATVDFAPIPQMSNTSLTQCDDGDNDGSTTFNLLESISDLTDSNDNISFHFYQSLSDLENQENELDDIFTNDTNPQNIYVEGINDISGCSANAVLTLQVSPSAEIPDYTFKACDNESETGLNNFNLEEIAQIINEENDFEYEMTFYQNEMDAILETNMISSPYSNTNPYTEVIFGRLENGNDCFGIMKVFLQVIPLPKLNENETLFYCLNTYPQPITLTSGLINPTGENHSFQWSTGETTPFIQTNQSGIFNITVTNTAGCSSSRTIVVENSNIATIENIQVFDGTDNNSITVLVSGEGEYEFALENDNQLLINYQANNTFNNVFPGSYNILIRDVKNNCGIVSQDISVIGFPKYFTPNGDGENDFWNIIGQSQHSKTEIYIYNRYGKLLTQINSNDRGWDGTSNGHLMPTDDYWFIAKMKDGRVFKSHFTLKR